MTCNSNKTCPESQYCLNRICTKENLCMTHDDCADDEQCGVGRKGIPQCTKVCERQPCGRHATCTGLLHQAVCACKQGYFGDPMQNCLKKECTSDSDCSDDKLCDRNMCKIVCLTKNICGEYSICSSEKHKQVCYCQPGFTGDPVKGCSKINWCSKNPCKDGAECKNLRDGAQCTCPTGTVGDPYSEGCRKALECRFNRDCPALARCTVSDGIRKCTGQFTYIQCLNYYIYSIILGTYLIGYTFV